MRLLDHIKIEHKELRPQIDELRTVADSIGTVSDKELMAGLEQSYDFLAHHLTPHAKSEEKVLYGLVAKYSHTDAGTEIMTRDHAEVAKLTTRLKGLMKDELDHNALRHVLYSLHSLISLHFAKEEEFILPVLEDHLTKDDDEHAADHLH